MMQSRVPPTQKDDINEGSFFATFGADEVLDLLNRVLEKNVTQFSTKSTINHSVSNSLLYAAWDEKAKKISLDLRRVAERIADSKRNQSHQPYNPMPELNSIEEELLDVISFIQLLSGFNPALAEEKGIPQNFFLSFRFLPRFVRNFRWPDGSQHEKITAMHIQFGTLCIRTLADIINLNASHFDGPDQLRFCLLTILDFDNGGMVAQLLNEPIRSYYERLVVLQFQAKPNSKSINAAMKAANATGIDISSALEMVSDDKRKYRALNSNCMDNPAIIDQMKKCAENTDDVDSLIDAMKKFDNDEAIQTRYAHKIAASMGDWLNSFIMTQRPTENEGVKAKFATFHELLKGLNEEDRRKVLSFVKDSELIVALKGMVERKIIDLRSTDPMMSDIRAILSAES